MRLYLVRHAQSEANVRKVLNTAMPGPPLTALGHQQARGLAERLGAEPIAAVYASRATRAQQTAEPLASALAMEVQVIDGVQEVFVGDLEDRGDEAALGTYFEVARQWVAGDLGPAMPGGETGRAVYDRFLGAIADVRAKHAEREADGAVVLVSHGGAIRFGAEWLAGNVSSELAGASLLENTGIVELETLDDGQWHCHVWGDLRL